MKQKKDKNESFPHIFLFFLNYGVYLQKNILNIGFERNKT